MKRVEYFRVQSTAKGLKLDSDASGLTYRKELIYVNEPGEHFTKRTKNHYQEFTVDEDLIDHWATTGNRMRENGVKIPTPLKHNDNPEANRGEIIRYETDINEDGRYALYGVVKFRDPKAAELAASTDVSIYVPEEPIFDSRNNKYEYAIRHVCFTDYPVIQGLSGFQAIAASLDRDELKLSTGAQIGRNILSRIKSLGKKAVNGSADYIKRNKLLTAAGVYSTGDFVDSRVRGNKHKTTGHDDTSGGRAGKLAHNTAVAGSAGVIGKHGLQELAHAVKGSGSLPVRALRAAVGAKSVLYAAHTGAEVAHQTTGHRKRGHALSLSDDKKKLSTLGRLGYGLAGTANVAGAVEASKQFAKVLALVAMKRKLKIPFTKAELAEIATVSVLAPALGIWSGIEGAHQLNRAFAGSLALADETEAEKIKRNSMGRFAPVPGSKWSQRMQRAKDRANEHMIKEISGYKPGVVGRAATENEPAIIRRAPIAPSALPTKKSLLESGAATIHDFYTASAAELGRGHNAFHAGKHALLALPTAAAGLGVGMTAAAAGKHALRWRKLDDTAVNAIKKVAKSITGPKSAVAAAGKMAPHVQKLLGGRGPAITKLIGATAGVGLAIGATTAQLRAAQLHASEALKRKK